MHTSYRKPGQSKINISGSGATSKMLWEVKEPALPPSPGRKPNRQRQERRREPPSREEPHVGCYLLGPCHRVSMALHQLLEGDGLHVQNAGDLHSNTSVVVRGQVPGTTGTRIPSQEVSPKHHRSQTSPKHIRRPLRVASRDPDST